MSTPGDVILDACQRSIDRQIADFASLRDRAGAGLAASGVLAGLIAPNLKSLTTGWPVGALIFGGIAVAVALFVLWPRPLQGDLDSMSNYQWAREAAPSDKNGSRLSLMYASVLDECYNANIPTLRCMRVSLGLVVVCTSIEGVCWVAALIRAAH